jgi:hypothetical protein
MADGKISERSVAALAAALAATIGSLAVVAQVKTNGPDVVPGARPAIVERIKIHGKALEGNLEGDAIDRDAIVLLPPSYNQNGTRRYPVVYALHGYSIGGAVDAGNPRAAGDRRGVREGCARDDRRAARLEDGPQRLDVFEQLVRRRRPIGGSRVRVARFHEDATIVLRSSESKVAATSG